MGGLRRGYAKRVERLAEVRDVSTGEIGQGYWLCEVLAARPHGDKAVPAPPAARCRQLVLPFAKPPD